MKFLALLNLVALSLSISAETLSFANPAVTLETQWVHPPGAMQESILHLHWTPELTLPFRVRLEMVMGGHRHGSAPISLIPITGEGGGYLTSGLYFTMSGSWEVCVEVNPPGESQCFSQTVP